MPAPPPDRAHISTEKRNPRTAHLHALSIAECVETIHREDRHAFEAVGRAEHRITAFIEAAEPGFLAGGRLIYVGAGTSGRLGVLDASEAPPTFQVPPDRIIGIIAGGDRSLRKSSEAKEDDPRGAWPDLEALNLTAQDSVLAIAAGGTTPYALGALEYAKSAGSTAADTATSTGRDGERKPRATTALLCCTTIEMPPHCDHLIVLKTGPEVLTGSTRMKAGTATKLTLNIISTTLMIRSGRVYENLMVDLRASNDKLRDRAARIVGSLTGLPREACFELLVRSGGAVKTAVVMQRMGLDRTGAEAALAAAADRLDRVLKPSP